MKHLPWIIAGGAALVGVFYLSRPRVDPATDAAEPGQGGKPATIGGIVDEFVGGGKAIAGAWASVRGLFGGADQGGEAGNPGKAPLTDATEATLRTPGARAGTVNTMRAPGSTVAPNLSSWADFAASGIYH